VVDRSRLAVAVTVDIVKLTPAPVERLSVNRGFSEEIVHHVCGPTCTDAEGHYPVSSQSGNDPNRMRFPEPRRLGGILVRKESWKLSFTGRIIVLVSVVIFFVVLQHGIYPFLAVDNPTSSGFLIVDAWLPDYGLRQAAAVFEQAKYENLIISGCTNQETEDPDFPSGDVVWAAAKLKKIGIPTRLVQPVPCSEIRKDRTYNSALAVKKWCDKMGVTVRSVDLVTKATHARRSRLLYQKVFGSKVKVGVIGVQDRNYDPAHWWQYTVGVRQVTWEGFAYIYTKFFFYPE